MRFLSSSVSCRFFTGRSFMFSRSEIYDRRRELQSLTTHPLGSVLKSKEVSRNFVVNFPDLNVALSISAM